ncbi:HSP90 family protein [soil metagenome]
MDHRFQINLGGIIDLLSNHLYSGPDVFVRELLQNCTDAIQARNLLESDFKGEITIECHETRGKPATIVFNDNGIGLTEEEVHRFLATIGESSKRANLWNEMVDFIGQFGIGLLSCFVVSEEIVLITQSARPGHPSLEWRGRPDGTYTLKKLTTAVAPGTHVYLTCKKEHSSLFQHDRIRDLLRHYGGLLPYPIRLVAGTRFELVNDDIVPWRLAFASVDERRQALLRFGREIFNADFLEAIPLESEPGSVEGVAFVLPHASSLAARHNHRVYLKNMLLSEKADNLLPEWAFFVRAVVNVNDLRPTASRESFCEDARLEATRAALGNCLRQFLIGLARTDPPRLHKLIALHFLSIKALAVEDDEFYRLFINLLPFRTTLGEMTLAQYLRDRKSIRYVRNLDEFRQVSQVATAQNLCLLNGAYVYDAELLDRYPEFFPEVEVEIVGPQDLAQTFDDLNQEEQDQVHNFLKAADVALREFKCSAEGKKFQPAELPVLYCTNSDGRFLRSKEQSQEIATPLWSGVLDKLGNSGQQSAGYSQVYFNFKNRLVRRLLQMEKGPRLTKILQLLYVQALLLGHHPLSKREMQILNDGVLNLIEWSIPTKE